MSEALRYTMFYDVLFPVVGGTDASDAGALSLEKVVRFRVDELKPLREMAVVIFDFETTGLDARLDRAIEIGAQRIEAGKVVAEFETLIDPEIIVNEKITAISGLTNADLRGQPTMTEILPKFLSFIDGAVLVAHNAEFDMAFLRESGRRLGYQIDWPCFCTLKLSRALLPQLTSRTLDSLAAHYGLQFEARHRSIGDVKVTRAVLQQIMGKEGGAITVWKQLATIAGVKV